MRNISRNKKKTECLYCGLSIKTALNLHHIRKGKIICLCANCHYILHGLFNTKEGYNFPLMTEQDVYNYLDAIYRDYNNTIKQQNLFPKLHENSLNKSLS